MDNEAFGVADVGQVRDKLQGFDEFPAGLNAPLDAEAKNSTASSLEILFSQSMAGMVLEAGVVNPGNGRMVRQNSATIWAFRQCLSIRRSRVSRP